MPTETVHKALAARWVRASVETRPERRNNVTAETGGSWLTRAATLVSSHRVVVPLCTASMAPIIGRPRAPLGIAFAHMELANDAGDLIATGSAAYVVG